mmetsp:Transcript_56349/g.113057  ORF Transcript_56349/g.113057 Transcript_56349/m.113057 type:complete len:212 (+) Transcript_56349:480-1115(+)
MVLLDLHAGLSRHYVLVEVGPQKSVVLAVQTHHLQVQRGLCEVAGGVLWRQLLYSLQPNVHGDHGLVEAAQVQAEGRDLGPRPSGLYRHRHRLVDWLGGFGRRGLSSGRSSSGGGCRSGRRGLRGRPRACACSGLDTVELCLEHVQHALQLIADVHPGRSPQHLGQLLAIGLELRLSRCMVDLHRHVKAGTSGHRPCPLLGEALILPKLHA